MGSPHSRKGMPTVRIRTYTNWERNRFTGSSLGPCDRKNWGLGASGLGGYGHFGAFPAQITVERFLDIETKVNPKSPYDYATMYHGPL